MAMSFLDGILGGGLAGALGTGGDRQLEQLEPEYQTYLDAKREQASSRVSTMISEYQNRQIQAAQGGRGPADRSELMQELLNIAVDWRGPGYATKEKATVGADSSKSFMPVVDLKPRRKIVFTDE